MTIQNDDRRNAQVGQERRRLRVTSALLSLIAALTGLLLLMPHRAYAVCDYNKGIDEVFYNFDKIIVLYGPFPNKEYEKAQDYPDALKYDYFNKRLLETINKNFASCLKNEQGIEKKIDVIPPPLQRNLQQKKEVEEVYDPKNLTIFIEVEYMPGHSMTPGIEEYGHIFFFMYRPDIAYKAARLPAPNKSGIATFFPGRGDKTLENQLNALFERIKPISQGRHIGPDSTF